MRYFLCAITLFLLFTSCIKQEELRVPKPVGYFRIVIPETDYTTFDSLSQFTFEHHSNAKPSLLAKENGEYWLDLDYPDFSATVKMTYLPLQDNLRTLVLEENKMVMFHVDQRMAEDVVDFAVHAPKDRVYGQIFELKGKNVASTMQFWLTDSVDHYVRGTLYFNFAQNNDSLAPVIDFLQDEIYHLVDTWKWETEDDNLAETIDTVNLSY